MAAACLSLGMKYAGTVHVAAYKVTRHNTFGVLHMLIVAILLSMAGIERIFVVF